MPSVTGAKLIAEVEALAKQAGEKYFYGGTSPSTGFDCSGLIYDALLKLGYTNPPRTSEEQYAWIVQNNTKVAANKLQAGDLVFAQFPGDNASPGHVGIYIGNGNIFSAQDPQLGIGISTISSWGSNIVGYGRVPDSTTSGAQGTGGDTSGGSGSLSIATAGSDVPGWISDVPGLGWLVGTASDVSDIATALQDATNMFALLFKPSLWFRVGAFFAGMVLLAFGIYLLAKTIDPDLHLPSAPPIPVPLPV